jgi:antitoxin (DNA-binding transcriptional repressor) of toxin-antitoxin stability system
MKAVNIRELKNNPSEALREARKNPVVVLNRDQPEGLIVHLDDDSLLAEPGVRLALGTALYRDESISLGQAARLAGIPIAEFMRHLSRLGISVIRGSPAAAREDAAVVDRRHAGSSRRTRTR